MAPHRKRTDVDRYLVTGGAGFIGSHVVVGCCELRARGAHPRQLLHRARGRTSRRRGRPRRGVRGRRAQLRARAQRGQGHRLRDPPRRPAVGAALRPGPAHHQRGQHHRHPEHAPGGARHGRAAGRPGLLLVGLRGHARRCPSTRACAGAHLALRGLQAGRRAVRARLLVGVRARDGLAAVLQRVRPAAGPQLAVQRRRPAVHAPRPRGRAAGGVRRRRRSRATSPMWPTWWTPRSAPPAAGRRGRASATSAAATPKTVLDLVAAISRARPGARSNPKFAPPRTGDVKHSFADIALARRARLRAERRLRRRASRARSPG